MNKFLALITLFIFLIEEVRLTNCRYKLDEKTLLFEQCDSEKERYKKAYLKANTNIKKPNKVFESGMFINTCYEIK